MSLKNASKAASNEARGHSYSTYVRRGKGLKVKQTRTPYVQGGGG